jgi:1-acyl-sn-glycerol-3-phosphate acyltransferase
MTVGHMSVQAQHPRAGWFLNRLALLLFRLTGWRTEGSVPNLPRFVVIAAPHTSYWDAIIMLTAGCAFDVKFSWMVKQAAFFFPLGIIVRWFGGIPIDRSRRTNVVTLAIEQFEASEALFLAVSPEGTRHKADHWKTGFYHIARGAGVPLVFGYVDFKRKVAGLGPTFEPTGDIEADFRVFEQFYSNVTPKFPELRGRVALRAEPEEPKKRAVA